MFNIKVSKPALVKAVSFVVGVVALGITQKYPALAPLLAFALKALGVSAVAAGRPQIVPKNPC